MRRSGCWVGVCFVLCLLGAPGVASAGPFDQSGYLKASLSGAGDEFGRSVAVSGDTMVVGAPGEASNATGVDNDEADNSIPGSGAVYVFTRSAGAWTQQAYLKASNTDIGANTESGDRFGRSVAISGDTITVGAPWEDSNATGINNDQADNSTLDSGAVYVFTRSAGAWTQQAYLKASNTDIGDEFGRSVAISGDTITVGAPWEDSEVDNSAPLSGAVYVFTRSAAAWSQQAHLKASNTDSGDEFGDSVAITGDTITVGAAFEDSNATGIDGNQADNSATLSGAVYVFTRSAAAWTQQAYLKASNTDPGDQFGRSVAISDDTITVGAIGEDSNATGIDNNQADNSAPLSGAVYVFTRSGGTWSQQAYLKASNTDSGDEFGDSVAISGDTITVGAPGEDSNATGIDNNQADNSTPFSGAVYVFTRSAAAWTQQAYLKASNTNSADVFGRSVAISGDTITVGAPGEDSNATGIDNNQADNSATDSGAVYAFGAGAPHVPVTLTVDDDKVQCPAAGFTSIQSAVDAAGPGDTINVCRGTYNENVTVGAGKDDVSLVSSTSSFAAVVKGSAPFTVAGGVEGVSIQKFRIETAAGGTGIAVGSLGESGEAELIRNNLVLGGAQGLSVANGDVDMARDNMIRDYTTNGVLVSGPGSYANVYNNALAGKPTSVGVNYFSVGIIVIGTGGTVFGNTISKNGVAGIIVNGAHPLVKANNVFDNKVGLSISGGGPPSSVENNKFTANAQEGIVTSTPGWTFLSNNAKANGGTDCVDSSPAGTGTAGTSNTWTGNYGLESSPVGICKK